LAYDGSDFVGWATQPNGPSVQAEIEKAIEKVVGVKTPINCAGRTDTGVHASGQVANFMTDASLELEEFKRAINANLPDSIKIYKVEEAAEDFHARFSAKWREYLYQIVVGSDEHIVFRRAYHLAYRSKLNLEAMREAGNYLLGEHDFSAFAAGEDDHSMVREIKFIKIASKSTEFYPGDTEGSKLKVLEFRIRGNGFLRRMVRLIVGTLLDVGRGKIAPDEVKRILDSKDNQKAGGAVPPQGLSLVRVGYKGEEE